MAIPKEWRKMLETKELEDYIAKHCSTLGDSQFKVLFYVKHEKWDGAVIANQRGTKFLTTGVLLRLLSGVSETTFNKMLIVGVDDIDLAKFVHSWNKNQTCKLIL